MSLTDGLLYVYNTMINDATLTALLYSVSSIYAERIPVDKTGNPAIVYSLQTSGVTNKVLLQPQILIKVYSETAGARAEITNRLIELFHYTSDQYTPIMENIDFTTEENLFRADMLIKIKIK